VAPTSFTLAQQGLLGERLQEYIDAQMVNADHPAAHTNVGNVYATRGVADAAEIAYRDAIRVDPTFGAAYLNLADLYRALERDEEGEAILRAGLERLPAEAVLHHALGLLHVRRGDTTEALRLLRLAVDLAPDQPRLAYVLGVALNSAGDWSGAREVMDAALARNPWDRDLLTFMTTGLRDEGHPGQALGYGVRLAQLAPDDPAVIQLLVELRRDAGRDGPRPD